MKTGLVRLSLVILSVLTVTDAAMPQMSYHKDLSSKTETIPSGLRRPLVPRPMYLETFRSQVAGRSYKELYLIQEPLPEFVGDTKNFNVTFTFLTATIVERAYDTRLQSSNECIQDASNIVVQSSRKAIFEVPEANITIWYFSTRPGQFLFEFGCFGQNFNQTGCFGDFFLSMFTANDPPNQFPWVFALRELFKQTRLTVLDPRSLYTRTLNACPEPLT